MKHTLTSSRRARAENFSLRPVALALACMGTAPAFAQLPTWNNFQVRGGVVSVGTPTAGGTQLGIAQSTQRAIIDWQGFSIGVGNTVNIRQPGVSSVLLNRVTGNELSTIAGSMNANGRVFLVNPNGVLFASGSTVNVGGLVASTLRLNTSDEAFMGGTERLEFKQDGNPFGSVENRGNITAGNGGTIALIGATVSNSGSMVAQGGTAGLVSADTVTVDFAGDGLTTFKLSSGLYSNVANSGLVQADGGRVVLMATSGGEVAQGVVNTQGVLRANSLATRGGEIVLDSGNSPAGVVIDGGLLSAAGNGAGLNGGTIDIKGRTILVQPFVPVEATFAALFEPDDRGIIDASGSAGGGSIRLQATAVGGNPQTGAIAVAAGSRIRADATEAGNGGDIRLMGERTLRAYGPISARGGPAGGNGGFIETSGGFAVPAGDTDGGIELTGLRTDASAPLGTAGTWLVDPFNVTITPGVAAGTLPGNPFDPIATSTIQDGDINAALNGGTSVRITTGNPAIGLATDGDILFDGGVNINYTAAKGPVAFQLDAHRSIRTNAPNVVIQSSGAGGPLDVVFNANANGASTAVGGGQISYDGNIYTNGGNVAMTGNWTASGFGDSSIHLTGIVDTRGGNTINPLNGASSGGSNALAGGSVLLNGNTTTPGLNPNSSEPGVWLNGAQIFSSTGAVTINGSSTNNTGVQIDAPQDIGGISTTSGAVTVTGRGRDHVDGSTFLVPAAGVLVSRASIGTVSGGITLRGHVDDIARPASVSAGLRVENGAQIVTTGGGDIELTGRAQANGIGFVLEAGGAPTAGNPAPSVQGSDQVVLRADNDRSTDAIAIAAPVSAGSVINLRPGGLDALGNASDSVNAPISLMGGAATGFAVSVAEMALLNAPVLVAGSDAHAADINVNGALSRAGGLTLQNEGGGNINLNAPVSAAQLGLLAGGNVNQAAGAPVTAGSLLASSKFGSVLLSNPANNVDTVGGGAAGRFEYVDVNRLTLGPVSVVGYNAAGNVPQLRSATSMAADTVLVRTLSQDLSLASNVSAATSTDLVAAARFQNLGAYTISGAPWRIWADTWLGETRGGLAGSGQLPNLYHCAYLGLCTVAIPPGANHFIYAQQPSAVIFVHNAARAGGVPNPLFTYSITGLILGDTGIGFIGAVSSPATRASLPGFYPINGSFTSAEGYAVTVVPGLLTVGDFVQLPKPDVLRDNPSTWLYDRNIGPAPICLASGPLAGDRAAQGGDELAREWARVRSRPNLTSCIDTERRNGCADF